MTTPKISVCIPVYNGDKFIKSTMDSVFAQTFKDFELVVLDNKSTDRTLDIVAQYDDKRLRVVKNEENIGVERNFNLALSEARGDYIKILCADDLLHPDCLEKQRGILDKEENSNVVLVSCKRKIVNEKDRVIMERGLAHGGTIPGSRAIKMAVRAGTNIIGEPSAVLIRKSALACAGGFDGTIPYIIDLDFWARLLSQGNLYVIAEPLCSFRIFRESCSFVIRKKQYRDFREFMRRLYKNGAHGISVFDFSIGKFNARLNTFKRNLLYKLLWIYS